MSFFWGRFDPIETQVDEEVKHLYRRRELDPQFKNKEVLIAAMTTSNTFNLDNSKANTSIFFSEAPNNAKYESMTEEERIENGMASKYHLFLASPYYLFGSIIWLGYSLLSYSKIYYPGGIILRRQRVEKPVSYLKKRGPLIAFSLLTIYNMLFYKLYYNIDYSSDYEDEIDREYRKIKKLAI